MSTTTTTTEERAISLLGQGLGPEIVASAIGVSPSRISQLISDPIFSARIAELRYSSLLEHSETDKRYDKMEADLQNKLADLIPFMMKPFEVLKAIQIINQAKRRGISSPEQIVGQQTVVQLIMPTQIFNQYSDQKIQLNVNNQVVRAGDQDLVTIQSGQMDKLLLESTPVPALLAISNLSAISTQKETNDVYTSTISASEITS